MAAPPGSKTLHDQNKDGAGNAILSDSFDDAQAADDFVVPKGHTWMVKEVDVTGVYLGGAGPADSENVIFYEDADGVPGAVVGPDNSNIVGTDSAGSFSVKLARSCDSPKEGFRATPEAAIVAAKRKLLRLRRFGSISMARVTWLNEKRSSRIGPLQ